MLQTGRTELERIKFLQDMYNFAKMNLISVWETKEEFNKVISKINNIQIEEVFVSNDVRKGRENEQWLNIFIKKLSNSPY